MMRKGSALLIVLGMMAFMVVSAVAFSMYMRQNRLPSSFLRQRLTASQLVKAGLAGAMQRIDAGVADNPYPGVGDAYKRQVEFKTKEGDRQTVNYGNYWHHRVFLESQLAKDGSLGGDDAELDFDTVSTLTLEGLAYLPPPLVNTVRLWSKRTSTASWQSLGYDAGRYAFTAVNVSDYFDVNRLHADVMRDSTPENRVAVGYLFENSDHTGGGTVRPADFDAFVGKVTNDVFRTRFVSLADYNVALGSGSYGDVGFVSPFWNYLDQNTRPGDGSFYGSSADSAKLQKFVTGSWFPGDLGGVAPDEIYLTNESKGQPFDGKEQSLYELQKTSGSDAYKIVRERVDVCSLGALYDYVDEDNVPISLAIPTLEHVPMLSGIQLVPSGFNLQLDSKETTEQKGTQDNPETWVRKAWWVKSFGDDPKVVFSACLAYPFARKSPMPRSSSYEVQVLVRAFLSREDEDFSKTRFETGFKPGKGDWKNDAALMAQDKAYITLFGSKKVSVSEGTDENHCAIDCSGIELSFDASAVLNTWVQGIYFRRKEDGTMDDTTCQYDASSENLALSSTQKKLMYRDLSTKRGAEVANGTKLRLNFAVWARVLDGENTVDLVPAMLTDDQEYNGHVSGDMGGDAPKVCGSTEPVMPHSSGTVLDLSLDRFKNSNGAQDPAEMGKLSLFCDDPRFNYAPEDWYLAEGDDIQPTKWLDAAKARCQGGGRRPTDIFQFVSDVGYLQSMGELQFLPYLAAFKSGNGGVPNGGFYDAAKYNGQPFANRTSAGSCANNGYAWQSHWAFGASRSDRSEGEDSDPYEWGISDSNGGTAISPYADEDQMMAAIANTPYDWTVAAGEWGLTLESGRPYTFGPGSDDARVDWTELKKVAAGIKGLVGTSTDWEEKLFNSTEAAQKWDDDNGPFGADFGESFHDVDRKFLYGYWRSCFANRQQLYLIFVRAEPAVMGGSSAGHTPSQLGARSVALVWRESESTIDDQTSGGGATAHPHRMRILFYHQFE